MFGPNSGKRADAWCAPDYTYFGAASSLGLFAVSYFKSDREGYKYDVFSQITANLKKGEICKPEIPAYVFVYSGKGSYLAHGKEFIEQDIK
jgi:hypothetical protein